MVIISFHLILRHNLFTEQQLKSYTVIHMGQKNHTEATSLIVWLKLKIDKLLAAALVVATAATIKQQHLQHPWYEQ